MNLIVFHSPKCPACHFLLPKIQSFASSKKMDLVMIDTTTPEGSAAAEAQQIERVPAVFVKLGDNVTELSGGVYTIIKKLEGMAPPSVSGIGEAIKKHKWVIGAGAVALAAAWLFNRPQLDFQEEEE